MYVTPEAVTAELKRRGPRAWNNLLDLVLADIWHRTCAYRTTHGLPLPPDHLRPRLADPRTTTQTEGEIRE